MWVQRRRRGAEENAEFNATDGISWRNGMGKRGAVRRLERRRQAGLPAPQNEFPERTQRQNLRALRKQREKAGFGLGSGQFPERCGTSGELRGSERVD